MPTGQNSSEITVFLGIYNGENYLQSLRNQLKSQKFQGFKLVVVDNASTDNSFEQLGAWKSEFGDRITLHMNDQNLGGGG